MDFFKKLKKITKTATAAATAVAISAGSAMAGITLPAIPTDDITAAGTMVASLVATTVGIGIVIRIIRRAG